MNENLLQQSIALARGGRKAEARALLEQVLAAEPQNETAWLWLADCAPTTAERIRVLEACVQAAPQAEMARRGLAALKRQAGAEASAAAAAGEAAADRAAAESAAEELPAATQEPAADDLPAAGEITAEQAPVDAETAAWLDAESGEQGEEEERPAGAVQVFATPEPPAAPPAGGASWYETAPGPEEPAGGAEDEATFPGGEAARTPEEVNLLAAFAAAEPAQDENEWPGMKDQVEMEPWMRDLAEEAGPGMETLVKEESAAPRAEEQPVEAFTRPPEAIPPEEFAQVEANTEAELRRGQQIRELNIQRQQRMSEAAPAEGEQAPAPAKPRARKQAGAWQIVLYGVLVGIGLVGLIVLLIGLYLVLQGGGIGF